MRSIGFPELLVIIGIVPLFGLFFLPSIIGWRKRDRLGIVVLNLMAGPFLFLYGLGGIGWIVALVWAFRCENREQLPAERVEAITKLNLAGGYPPAGGQPAHVPPYVYTPPPVAAGLPTWLMALLFAFIIAGVIYLGAGYFRNADPATSATHPQPGKVHRKEVSK
jgi:hypothetical protein